MTCSELQLKVCLRASRARETCANPVTSCVHVSAHENVRESSTSAFPSLWALVTSQSGITCTAMGTRNVRESGDVMRPRQRARNRARNVHVGRFHRCGRFVAGQTRDVNSRRIRKTYAKTSTSCVRVDVRDLVRISCTSAFPSLWAFVAGQTRDVDVRRARFWCAFPCASAASPCVLNNATSLAVQNSHVRAPDRVRARVLASPFAPAF